MATNQVNVTAVTQKKTIQIGDNTFQMGNFANSATGAELPVGAILARNTTTGNIVILDIAATTTNANSPIGFNTDARDFGISEVKNITYVTGGKIDEDMIVFPAGVTMDTIIETTGTPGAKTLRDYLTGMGFEIFKPQ